MSEYDQEHSQFVTVRYSKKIIIIVFFSSIVEDLRTRAPLNMNMC